MGAFFVKGETKTRAGIYRRHEKREDAVTSSNDYSTVAIVLTSNWGPLGKASVIESLEAAKAQYGTSSNVKKTLLTVMQLGIKKCVVIRTGTGGAKATLTLKDTTASTAVSVVKLDTKYETDRSFKISIRERAGDVSTKIIDVIEGTTAVESFSFAAGDGELSNLITIINESSTVLNATKLADGNGKLATINQVAMTNGENPQTPANSDYAAALEVLEPYHFDVLITDTNSTDVHATIYAYMTRIKEEGALNIAVVGEPTSVAFDTRLDHAKAFNSEIMVYVGGAYIDEERNSIEGAEAAAVTGALIAITSSDSSIVHSEITGAVDVKEKLTNSQYEKAIRNGCILFSKNADDTVLIESGVNTLVHPDTDADEGWIKIKRVRVRHELFNRIDKALNPIIGKINCDDNGVNNVVRLGKGVITEMIQESKLSDGDMYEDSENPRTNDSAYFIVRADDVDTLEKIYLAYQFRFTRNA